MERRKKIIEKVFIILVLIVITTNLLTPVIKAALPDGLVRWDDYKHTWYAYDFEMPDEYYDMKNWSAKDYEISEEQIQAAIKEYPNSSVGEKGIRDNAKAFNDILKKIEQENKQKSDKDKTNLGQALINSEYQGSVSQTSDAADEMPRKRCRW